MYLNTNIPATTSAENEYDLTNLPVSVQTIVGLVSTGHTRDEIVGAYPFLRTEDITECYEYAEMLEGTLHS